MAPVEDEGLSIPASGLPPQKSAPDTSNKALDEWTNEVDEVSAQIRGIIDGTITDFDAFDKQWELKERAKQIRAEELQAKKERFFSYGIEGKGEGTRYKWWCKRCFVEYQVDLPENTCTRCKQSDKMMTQEARREELMGKLSDFKEAKTKHQWRKDKWLRWKKSQALLKRSRNVNYKAWEYWEPDTDSDEEGDPIVPRDNPEFLAMEADIKSRHKKLADKALTAGKCRERGNQCMKDGDFVGAIEHYDEGLEYKRDDKALWTNKALAETKVFRWHDAIASCNKVIEYSEIFEDGFRKSADACFKAFVRRAVALRALHRWKEAVEDLEDALQLFPRDRDARDLLEKTKVAEVEAKQVPDLLPEQEETAGAPPASTAPAETVEAVEPAEQVGGPVHVEIEESDDEEDEAVAAAQPGSLAGLNGKDFDALLERLRGKPAERAVFCARRGGGPAEPAPKKGGDQWQGRKIDLKVAEEVAEPSRLDIALKDVERCCVLWKKSQGGGVALRSDVKYVGGAEEEEDLEATAFLRVATPRVLAVLHVLASGSDHHCALTATAVRHVWPLLACEAWRQTVLELLSEWSQRAISVRAMAEFAGRYPEPHLRLLIEAITEEKKENVLPPGFEALAEMASKRLDGGEQSIDAALDEMLQGLSKQSPSELAVSTLGNVCLAGTSVPLFKEHVQPFRDTLIDALRRNLRAVNWRLCGRAAGALCNVMRLGDAFATAVHERCLEPLIQALREESTTEGPSAMMRTLQEGGAAGQLPFAGATARLLGALVNLLLVRPAATAEALERGLLPLAVPLINAEAVSGGGGGELDGEGDAAEISQRAALLTSRLLSAAPSALPGSIEVDLLRRLRDILERSRRDKFVRVGAAAAAILEPGAAATPGMRELEQLELAVRMLTIVLTKTPGALDRLTAAAPRVQELPEDGAMPAVPEPAVPFGDLAAGLLQLNLGVHPSAHVGPEGEGSVASRLRGNLALLFAALSEAQAREGAPPALRSLDLSRLVASVVDAMRKERGAVQNNIGVCLTQLARNERYRQQVRDLNGMESLHQIQLRRVQAQKAEEEKKHRLETSQSARQHEISKRRSASGA